MTRSRRKKGPSSYIIGALASVFAIVALIGGVSLVDGSVTADASDGGAPSSEVTEREVPQLDTAPLNPGSVTTLGSAPNPLAAETSTEAVATALLDTLEVKGRAPKSGYDRKAKFGTPWTDIDRNGCDTRNDILQRDLVDTELSGPCKVLSGTLNDKYTGDTIDFVRGNTTSTLVQIDHVVALSDAWQKGGQALTQTQRITLPMIHST